MCSAEGEGAGAAGIGALACGGEEAVAPGDCDDAAGTGTGCGAEPLGAPAGAVVCDDEGVALVVGEAEAEGAGGSADELAAGPCCGCARRGANTTSSAPPSTSCGATPRTVRAALRARVLFIEGSSFHQRPQPGREALQHP